MAIYSSWNTAEGLGPERSPEPSSSSQGMHETQAPQTLPGLPLGGA